MAPLRGDVVDRVSEGQFKKRLILKKVPKTATIKKLQEQFSEAQIHTIKFQRDKSNFNDLVVRLEFETEEAAMEFYEKKKNDLTIDNRKINVTYPYKDTMPQKKKPEKNVVPNNPAKSPASSAGTSRRNMGPSGNTGHGGNMGPAGRGGWRGRGGFNRNSGNTGNLGLTQQAAIRKQQIMLQQQQQQQMLAQQSNMGMGGMGMFGSGVMNQGQGLVSRNQSGMYGSGSGGYRSAGGMGGGYSGGQMGDGGQGGDSDDDPAMIMASLKSALAKMEQKMMSGGVGGDRTGGKRKGGGYDSYDRSDNKRQYGGSSYGQNPNYY